MTQAKMLFETVATAIDWFRSDFWRGPRPTRETVFKGDSFRMAASG
jgi:hypothetical protein